MLIRHITQHLLRKEKKEVKQGKKEVNIQYLNKDRSPVTLHESNPYLFVPLSCFCAFHNVVRASWLDVCPASIIVRRRK